MKIFEWVPSVQALGITSSSWQPDIIMTSLRICLQLQHTIATIGI